MYCIKCKINECNDTSTLCINCENNNKHRISGPLHIHSLVLILWIATYTLVLLQYLFGSIILLVYYPNQYGPSLVTFIICFFIGLFLFTSIVSYFKKKKIALKRMIIFHSITIIILLIGGIEKFINSGEFTLSTLGVIIVATLTSSIWIAYFILSKRVESIFVN